VIVGTNFGSSGIPAVEFQSSTGVITAASTVTRDSATQLTVGATIPTDGTYYIRIELNTGLAVRSTTAVLTVSDAPVWTTGAGSLGIIAGDFSGTVATVAATGDGVEYTETTDVLENATLANCSLNSSTGVITTTDFGADDTVPTTFTFTIRATDDQGQTSDREFTLTSSYTYACAFLVVAGGASGGGGGYGGAGGAGGYRNSYLSEASGGGGSSEADLGLSEGTVYTIDVGDGGASVGSSTLGIDGADSSISGSDITNIVTDGGGRGGNDAGGSIPGGDGGSGGGAASWNDSIYGPGGSAVTNNGFAQGYAGGVSGIGVGSGANSGSGGGGGAGAVGGAGSGWTPGTGGNGLASSITGSSVTRAAGGGGMSYYGGDQGDNGGSSGIGGRGAMGDAAQGGPIQATAGDTNTGSGGGAASHNSSSYNSGAGGSGVVILRMATADYSGTTSGSPTVSTDGSDTILIFNADGTYTG